MAEEQEDKNPITYGEGFWVISGSHFSLWELPPGSAFSLNNYTVVDGRQLSGGNIIRVIKTDPETGWIQAELLVPQTMSEHAWTKFWISIEDSFQLERNARIGNYGEDE